MTTQQTDRRGELAVAIAKLQEPIQKLLPVWAEELEAKKDEPTNWHGAFDFDDGLVLKPDRGAMSLAKKAALLAAMHDVVFEGEGVELMGLWHGMNIDDLNDRGLTELRAATAFRAMMHRMRQADWRDFAVLERILSEIVSSPGMQSKRDDDGQEPASKSNQQEQPTAKPPSEKAWQAYQVKNLMGITNQTDLARKMIEQGVSCDQGTVSRWLAQIDEWFAAGGSPPKMTDPMRPAVATDPAVIDKGERTDHRTRHQRSKQD